MKLILNRSVGASFCLSEKGATRLRVLKNEKAIGFSSTRNYIPRNDPDLVRVVEELGAEAAGPNNELLVIDIPENSPWRISDVVGYEFVIANGQIY
jgi:hypothetical protein